ncbi:MAG: tetratricopeptide repeat protein [Flavobacterium sp.]|nr:tetratricopeptide repeat protein [Flavobacterium sp.]
MLYLKKAIQYSDKTKTEQLGLLYGDIGLTLLKQKKTKESLVYFEKTALLTKTNNSQRLLFFTKRNFGEYYNNTKEYPKAIANYEEALQLSESQNDAFQKIDLLYTLSGLYYETKNYNKSLDYSFQSLELAKKFNAKEFLFRSQKRISTIYNQLGQYQKGYDHLLISSNLKDTLLNEDHIKQLTLTSDAI